MYNSNYKTRRIDEWHLNLIFNISSIVWLLDWIHRLYHGKRGKFKLFLFLMSQKIHGFPTEKYCAAHIGSNVRYFVHIETAQLLTAAGDL